LNGSSGAMQHYGAPAGSVRTLSLSRVSLPNSLSLTHAPSRERSRSLSRSLFLAVSPPPPSSSFSLSLSLALSLSLGSLSLSLTAPCGITDVTGLAGCRESGLELEPLRAVTV